MKLGKKSGPPPKRGPNPQGLNIKNNTVKTVKLKKKIRGENNYGGTISSSGNSSR